ncbi:MAG: M48 family metallopeptidase [Candidatus Pacebacteria bacterium]|nr:M48 family metallopeptidase [Candidatus Paceibacterota bacterium]
MKKEIQLHKQKVEYTLKVSKRAKRMRLAIYCDGSFVVTAPQYVSESIIEQFIVQKSQWVIDKLEYFKKFSGQVAIKGAKKDYIKYKQQALTLALARIEHFNKFYGLKVNRVNIKNQKTRWGSCSKKGNLNFNYKIVLLPQRLADYIIVHELCHLKEFNHGPKFWNLVSQTIPDYLEIRKELKENMVSV